MIEVIKALSKTQKRHGVLIALCLLLLGALYLYLMKPGIVGLLYDDGMYFMSALALAKGEGYRLSGMIAQPYLYKYPPLYPALLALVLQPLKLLGLSSLALTVPYLKAMNIALALLSLAVLYGFARRHQRLSFPLALSVVLLLGTNARFAELATELMSEPLYFLLSLLVLYLTEASLEKPESLTIKRLMGIIALSVLAFYTRTVGILLMVAVFSYLLLKKQNRAAFTYALSSGISILPWFLWSMQQTHVTPKIGAFLVRTFQEGYFQSFQFDLKESGTLWHLYSEGFSQLLGNLSLQFFLPLERLLLTKETPFSAAIILSVSFMLALGLGYHLYLAVKHRQWSVSGLYTGFYLLILPFWSYYSVYPRFLLMILPFLWIALIHRVQDSSYKEKAKKNALLGLMLMALVCNVFHWFPALVKENPNQLLVNNPRDLARDYFDAAAYLKKHTAPNTLIASEAGDEAYFYALNAHRKTLDTMLFLPKQVLDSQCPSSSNEKVMVGCLQNMMTQRAEAFYIELKQQGIRYVIGNHFTVKTKSYNTGVLVQRQDLLLPFLQSLHPGSLLPVYRSPDDWIIVYRVE
jgi:hypothetical protein